MLSILIPLTELKNLPEFVEHLRATLTDINHELLVVNFDSNQSLPIQELSAGGHEIRAIEADNNTSLLDYLDDCSFDRVLILDVRLDATKLAINDMLSELSQCPDGLVVGTRNRGDRKNAPNSLIETLLVRPLTDCADPTSDVLLFDKTNLPSEQLNVSGLNEDVNLGLELIVRGGFSKVIEVPTSFHRLDKRASWIRERLNFLRHLRRLYVYRFGSLGEFINFGAVGASGFLVDISFYFLLQWLGLGHVAARAISFWPAVSWNWALNRLTTFGERKKRPRTLQWIEFVSSSGVGFILSWGTYTYLTTSIEFFERQKIVALIAGILLASLFNFTASSFFVFSNKRSLGGKS